MERERGGERPHTEHDTSQDRRGGVEGERRRGGDRALLCAPRYLAIEQGRVSRIPAGFFRNTGTLFPPSWASKKLGHGR